MIDGISSELYIMAAAKLPAESVIRLTMPKQNKAIDLSSFHFQKNACFTARNSEFNKCKQIRNEPKLF